MELSIVLNGQNPTAAADGYYPGPMIRRCVSGTCREARARANASLRVTRTRCSAVPFPGARMDGDGRCRGRGTRLVACGIVNQRLTLLSGWRATPLLSIAAAGPPQTGVRGGLRPEHTTKRLEFGQHRRPYVCMSCVGTLVGCGDVPGRLQTVGSVGCCLQVGTRLCGCGSSSTMQTRMTLII